MTVTPTPAHFHRRVKTATMKTPPAMKNAWPRPAHMLSSHIMSNHSAVTRDGGRTAAVKATQRNQQGSRTSRDRARSSAGAVGRQLFGRWFRSRGRSGPCRAQCLFPSALGFAGSGVASRCDDEHGRHTCAVQLEMERRTLGSFWSGQRNCTRRQSHGSSLTTVRIHAEGYLAGKRLFLQEVEPRLPSVGV